MGTKVLTSCMGGSLDPALMVLLYGKPVCRRCWRKERVGKLRKVGKNPRKCRKFPVLFPLLSLSSLSPIHKTLFAFSTTFHQ